MKLTVDEIAKLLDVSKKTVFRKIKARILKSEKVPRECGGFEYRIPLETLPPELQLKYWEMKKTCEGAAAPSSPLSPPPSLALSSPQQPSLTGTHIDPSNNAIYASSHPGGDHFVPAIINSAKDWQREVADARLTIIKKFLGRRGIKKEILDFISNCENKDLIKKANFRDGGDDEVSYQTIIRWINQYEKFGYAGLIPKTYEKRLIPEWAYDFLKLYRRPSRPSIQWIYNLMRTSGISLPSYSTVYRFIQKFSRVDINKGRMSSREIKACKGFTRRDFSHLYPTDVYVIDGHSFKAKVKHPITGKPFFPEVCVAIDVATRAWVGWSVGIAESSQVVAECIRHAISVSKNKPFGGLPAIVYTDKGAGNMAKYMTDEVTGIFERIGVVHKTSIAGNPQARGVVERFMAYLINIAGEMPSFRHERGSEDAYKSIYLMIEKDLREKGDTDKVISWNQFICTLNFFQNHYNTFHRHTALPKIQDPETGEMRHLSPGEYWAEFVKKGWRPELLSDDELESLKRPRITAITRRGEIRCLSNIYFNKELSHYHGMEMIVEYDIHDPSKVWVRDLEGRLVCIAEWNANVKAYFPKSAVEEALEKRAKARLRRIQNKLEEINSEIARNIECTPQQTLPKQTITKEKEKEIAEMMARLEREEKEKNKKHETIPTDMFEKYNFWQRINQEIEKGIVYTDEIMTFHKNYVNTAEFRAIAKLLNDDKKAANS